MVDVNAIRDYILKGPPYMGRCPREHNNRVYALGAKYIAKSKEWQADSRRTLLSLLNTGVWTPTGIPEGDTIFIEPLIHKIELDETMQAAKILAEKKRKYEQQREEREAIQAAHARKELNIPENEAVHLQAARAHGVDDEIIEESAAWTFLGPRSGISDAQRLVRGVKLGLCTWEEVASKKVPECKNGRGKSEGISNQQRVTRSSETAGSMSKKSRRN